MSLRPVKKTLARDYVDQEVQTDQMPAQVQVQSNNMPTGDIPSGNKSPPPPLNDEQEDYDLHPKLQELLEHFVNPDRFTLVPIDQLTKILNILDQIKSKLDIT